MLFTDSNKNPEFRVRRRNTSVSSTAAGSLGVCILVEQDVSKMVNAMPELEIKEIHAAMEGVFQRMKENLTAEGILPDKLPKRA